VREDGHHDTDGSGPGAGPASGGQDARAMVPSLPVDPDLPVEPPLRNASAHLLRGRLDILAVISAGGAVGSAARYAVAEAIPHEPGKLAWSTFTVNVTGGFLLGLLMVFVLDVWPPSRYLRPFFGVGVLGGFTTFSTYMLDTHALLAAGEIIAALTYVLGTLVVGLAAVWLGVFTARWLSTLPRRERRPRDDSSSNPAPRSTP
jgi:fluoride exporter